MPFQSGEENKKAPVMVKAEATAAELAALEAAEPGQQWLSPSHLQGTHVLD